MVRLCRRVPHREHNGFELLCNGRCARIRLHQGGGHAIHQRRKLDLLRPGDNDVAEADVHLKRNPGIPQTGGQLDPLTGIRLSGADREDSQAAQIESNCVFRTRYTADRCHKLSDAALVGAIQGQHVDIPRRSIGLVHPHGQEARPFEDAAVAYGRRAQPIEEPLARVARN